MVCDTHYWPNGIQSSHSGSSRERQGRELLHPRMCPWRGAVLQGMKGMVPGQGQFLKRKGMSPRLLWPVTWSRRPSHRTCPTLLAISTSDLEPVTIYFWTSKFSSLLTRAPGAILGCCQGWSPGWLTHPPTRWGVGPRLAGFGFQLSECFPV